jgi:hypothetical protein
MNICEDFSMNYPKDEIELRNKNGEIINEMKNSFTKLVTSDYEQALVEVINPDGFYPYYTHQKIKILFIGKEALGLYGNDYIEAIFKGIQSNDPRGHREWNKTHTTNRYSQVMTNNSDPFHKKMLYIAYGLNNNNCSYSDMPWASDIGENLFGRSEGIDSLQGETGISYAFINYSKFDNPSEESYSADVNRMQTYTNMVKQSGVNWFAKQISLLNPDLIIDMNINREYINNLGAKPVDWIPFDDDLAICHLPIEDKEYLLFETWHFSRPGMGFEEKFYSPITEAWKKFGKKN